MVKVDGSSNGKSLITVRDLDKTYKRGGRRNPRPAGTEPGRGSGRVRGLHGTQRFRENHAAESAGRAGCADARQHYRGGRRSHAHVREQVDGVARAARGLHLPDVQPDSGAERVSERRAAASADQAFQGGASHARGDCALHCWAWPTACITFRGNFPADRSSA